MPYPSKRHPEPSSNQIQVFNTLRDDFSQINLCFEGVNWKDFRSQYIINRLAEIVERKIQNNRHETSLSRSQAANKELKKLSNGVFVV